MTARPDALWFTDSRVNVRLSARDNAGGIAVLEHQLPFGAAPPTHVHHDEDEVFHILEGAIRFRVGDAERIGRAGDTVTAPRGVPHAFRVESPLGARVITVTRGGFEAMVRSVSRPAEDAGLPPREAPTPAMIEAMGDACRANGIDLLGPPLA